MFNNCRPKRKTSILINTPTKELNNFKDKNLSFKDYFNTLDTEDLDMQNLTELRKSGASNSHINDKKFQQENERLK